MTNIQKIEESLKYRYTIKKEKLTRNMFFTYIFPFLVNNGQIDLLEISQDEYERKTTKETKR